MNNSTGTSTKGSPQLATFAGGCFWGVQELIRGLPGVIKTQVGYTGGHLANPSYRDICEKNTGHTEAIQVEFVPDILPYSKLLKFFFRIHDPTTTNRQGNDIGPQYRSAIFYQSLEQKALAEEVKALVEASGHWSGPLVTEILPASEFYPAEEEHQDYLQKHPHGYTCHFVRPFEF